LEKGTQIRTSLEKFLHIFESEQEPVSSCQLDYFELQERLEQTRREERTVLKFLCQVPENIPIIEMLHLEQAIDRMSVVWSKDFKFIETFVATVKLEMVLEKFYFNFFEVPHILVIKKYKKVDF
jgi:hypothetical protein